MANLHLPSLSWLSLIPLAIVLQLIVLFKSSRYLSASLALAGVNAVEEQHVFESVAEKLENFEENLAKNDRIYLGENGSGGSGGNHQHDNPNENGKIENIEIEKESKSSSAIPSPSKIPSSPTPTSSTTSNQGINSSGSRTESGNLNSPKPNSNQFSSCDEGVENQNQKSSINSCNSAKNTNDKQMGSSSSSSSPQKKKEHNLNNQLNQQSNKKGTQTSQSHSQAHSQPNKKASDQTQNQRKPTQTNREKRNINTGQGYSSRNYSKVSKTLTPKFFEALLATSSILSFLILAFELWHWRNHGHSYIEQKSMAWLAPFLSCPSSGSHCYPPGYIEGNSRHYAQLHAQRAGKMLGGSGGRDPGGPGQDYDPRCSERDPGKNSPHDRDGYHGGHNGHLSFKDINKYDIRQANSGNYSPSGQNYLLDHDPNSEDLDSQKSSSPGHLASSTAHLDRLTSTIAANPNHPANQHPNNQHAAYQSMLSSDPRFSNISHSGHCSAPIYSSPNYPFYSNMHKNYMRLLRGVEYKRFNQNKKVDPVTQYSRKLTDNDLRKNFTCKMDRERRCDEIMANAWTLPTEEKIIGDLRGSYMTGSVHSIRRRVRTSYIDPLLYGGQKSPPILPRSLRNSPFQHQQQNIKAQLSKTQHFIFREFP